MASDPLRRFAGAFEALIRRHRLFVTLYALAVALTPLFARLVAGEASTVEGAAVRAFSFGSVFLVLVLDQGLVESRRRSPSAILWAQKAGFIEVRFAWSLFVYAGSAVLLILGVGGVTALTTHVGAGSGRIILEAIPGVLLISGIFGVFVATAAAWGSGRPAAVALVLCFAALLLGIRVFRTPESLGPFLPVAEWFALPADQIEFLLQGHTGGTGIRMAAAVRRVAGYLLGWLLLAAVGLAVTSRGRVGGGG